MANPQYEVAVLGLGGMGSAAAYHLARRGVKVLGIDQFEPPHHLGSSHGETRVIREAYFEHPIYVPLVQKAYELWSDLERASGSDLYVKTGGVMIGARDSTVFSGALRSTQEHRLEHEVLTAEEIRRKFPGLNPSNEQCGVLEPRAGILYPEACVGAHLSRAKKLGATIRLGEKVITWKADADEVTIRTHDSEWTAGKLIIAAGPWMATSVPLLEKVLTVEREVLLWFEALEPELFKPDRFPIHLWEYEPSRMFYGFPDFGTGVKVALHHQGARTTPEGVKREVSESDIDALRILLDRFLPKANGKFLRGTVCLYTNTPDGHFIIDFHPDSSRVVLASPCSGHGFKFASAIGEVLADLAVGGKSDFDLSLFALDRFGG